MSRVRVAGLLLCAAVVAVAVLLISGGGDKAKRTASACPPGQGIMRGEADGDRDKGEPGDYESHFRGKCAPLNHPESPKDLEKFNEFGSTRQGGDSPNAMAKAVRQKQRLQAAANGATLVDWYTASIGHDACKPPGIMWVEAPVPMNAAAPV